VFFRSQEKCDIPAADIYTVLLPINKRVKKYTNEGPTALLHLHLDRLDTRLQGIDGSEEIPLEVLQSPHEDQVPNKKWNSLLLHKLLFEMFNAHCNSRKKKGQSRFHDIYSSIAAIITTTAFFCSTHLYG
jgi:hypothetical protein